MSVNPRASLARRTYAGNGHFLRGLWGDVSAPTPISAILPSRLAGRWPSDDARRTGSLTFCAVSTRGPRKTEMTRGRRVPVSIASRPVRSTAAGRRARRRGPRPRYPACCSSLRGRHTHTWGHQYGASAATPGRQDPRPPVQVDDADLRVVEQAGHGRAQRPPAARPPRAAATGEFASPSIAGPGAATARSAPAACRPRFVPGGAVDPGDTALGLMACRARRPPRTSRPRPGP